MEIFLQEKSSPEKKWKFSERKICQMLFEICPVKGICCVRIISYRLLCHLFEFFSGDKNKKKTLNTNHVNWLISH
jgi:hypothetical protein